MALFLSLWLRLCCAKPFVVNSPILKFFGCGSAALCSLRLKILLPRVVRDLTREPELETRNREAKPRFYFTLPRSAPPPAAPLLWAELLSGAPGRPRPSRLRRLTRRQNCSHPHSRAPRRRPKPSTPRRFGAT